LKECLTRSFILEAGHQLREGLCRFHMASMMLRPL
jgi:hypothetical protein